MAVRRLCCWRVALYVAALWSVAGAGAALSGPFGASTRITLCLALAGSADGQEKPKKLTDAEITLSGPTATRKLGMQQWITPTFEIESENGVAAGIDGEAVRLDPPLRFRTRPAALRVRIAPHHPGASPSALEPEKAWQTIQTLVAFVLHGGPPDPEPAR